MPNGNCNVVLEGVTLLYSTLKGSMHGGDLGLEESFGHWLAITCFSLCVCGKLNFGHVYAFSYSVLGNIKINFEFLRGVIIINCSRREVAL